MRNACIIGVSGYGGTHYYALLGQIGVGAMRAIGATVINQDEEKDKCGSLKALGAELFTDYREMLDRFRGRIDLCFIPTGIHLHAPMTVDALKAGANVYVEKPVAATVQDVDEMRRHAERAGRIVAVGYQSMYAGDLLEFKQKLREYVGVPQVYKAIVGGARPDSYYARNGWAGRLKAGSAWVLDSPFNNAFAHRLNLFCFLAGEGLTDSARVTHVQAELYRARQDIESTDTACLKMSTADGPEILYYVTHCPDEDPGLVEIRGDRGALRWGDGAEPRFQPLSGEARPVRFPFSARPLYPEIMERVRRRLDDGKTFVCELRHAGVHTLCVNGAHESSPIHPVDPAFVTRAPRRDSMRTVLTGIDGVMSEAFGKECLFSDLDAPWARPGRVVAMENYKRFDGGALRTGG